MNGGEFEKEINEEFNQRIQKSIKVSKRRLLNYINKFNKTTKTTPEERSNLLVDFLKEKFKLK
jgi:hypothetical protein